MPRQFPTRLLHGLLAGVILVLLSAGICHGPAGDGTGTGAAAREDRITPRSPKPVPVEPGPWLEVDAEAARGLEGLTIYHQGPAPPVLIERAAARLPASSEQVNGPAIVQTVVSADGRVARMQVVRAPKVPGLTEALVEALDRWRFEPAHLDGEPVPVYYMVTVELRSAS